MLILMMILRWDNIDVDDDIWDEMTLMLMMTLRWDNVDVDVNDVIVMGVGYVCTWGAVTCWIYLEREGDWFQNSKHPWRGEEIA